jgi:trk system potassium uptake protein TrkA
MRVVLVAEGKTAYFLARSLTGNGHHVSVVSSDREEAVELSRRLAVTVLVGHGARAEVLDEAGALGADIVMALTPLDHDNLITCQVARRVFSVPRTVALANDPENRAIFERLGVDTVISTTALMARVVEQTTSVEDLRDLVPLAGGEILVGDVVLSEDAPAAGMRLAEFGARSKGLVAAILRNGQALIPDGATQLLAGDRLIVVAGAADNGAFLRELAGNGDRSAQ